MSFNGKPLCAPNRLKGARPLQKGKSPSKFKLQGCALPIGTINETCTGWQRKECDTRLTREDTVQLVTNQQQNKSFPRHVGSLVLCEGK